MLPSQSQLVENFPRRGVVDEWTPEELAIQQLIWDIEKLGGSTKLTSCVMFLGHAKDALSDHLEGIE